MKGITREQIFDFAKVNPLGSINAKIIFEI